ncbi:TPA: DUF4760 domain-containing protein [Kluyvera ascorbata]|uniref:DUF4760 domain-containing protein n=1 Tax=Kluyvera ascorbata TaxID=51288 RepID=UPI00204F3ADD|nr:DUF4760 domain-containing protein [Kluyvera ascorbata]DAE80667.1 MAG TPA: protein of unknown function DUF4760 [Caudoviricetes sp.]MDU1198740.1 DUF4760 domain-containing protein [Kluyvera ascorbata]HCL5623485.1 DUF4760 domain-containing protein [Kluyvera ascorbata]HED3202875.1 DUF4760 domain-containing protein [Kluyvera ascorbata]HED4089329.1 DUF4760 domain-containing protein [Kluyvera ascorbata]
MTLDANTLSIISSAVVFLGVVAAIVTIIYNVRTAKKTQTANFLFESRQDAQYLESLHVLKQVHRSGKSFRAYVFPCNGGAITEDEMVERRKFQYILNFYERVAVSIREGIYNEEMIKRTSYSTVIETFDIAEPLIKAIREHINSETTYQEFEWLVKRWKKNPLKKNK